MYCLGPRPTYCKKCITKLIFSFRNLSNDIYVNWVQQFVLMHNHKFVISNINQKNSTISQSCSLGNKQSMYIGTLVWPEFMLTIIFCCFEFCCICTWFGLDGRNAASCEGLAWLTVCLVESDRDSWVLGLGGTFGGIFFLGELELPPGNAFSAVVLTSLFRTPLNITRHSVIKLIECKHIRLIALMCFVSLHVWSYLPVQQCIGWLISYPRYIYCLWWQVLRAAKKQLRLSLLLSQKFRKSTSFSKTLNRWWIPKSTSQKSNRL